MKKNIVILLCLLAKMTLAQSQLTIVSDETWDVSNKEITMGEYPMSYAQYQALERTMDADPAHAIYTRIYDSSKVISGTQPIWRTFRASENWDSYAFRKVFLLGNNAITSAKLIVNCDDIARVYVNGKLLDTKRLHQKIDTRNGNSVDFKQLSAFMYDKTYEYDIKNCLFTNVKNTILVEVGNETYNDNHAYLSAFLNVVFKDDKATITPIAEVKIKDKTQPKPVVKPTTRPVQPQAVVISQPAVQPQETQKNTDMSKLKVGDVMELKDIFFKRDEYFLGEDSQGMLNKLYEFLQKNQTVKIEIAGHSNLIPDADYCKRLSEKRANAVQEYLVFKGINVSRLQHIGYGKSQPKVNAKTPEANQQNQRVEIKILAK